MGRSLCIAASAMTLGGCLFAQEETDQRKALKAYDACLVQAATKMEDGRSDSATLARLISPACSIEFQKVVQANNTKGRKEFETAMQAKQVDFAQQVVESRRKERCSK